MDTAAAAAAAAGKVADIAGGKTAGAIAAVMERDQTQALVVQEAPDIEDSLEEDIALRRWAAIALDIVVHAEGQRIL